MKKTLVMAAAAVLTGSMAYPSLAEEYVFEMAPVVVTANRMNENLVDARADISVVTSRQIEKLHLNTVEDALRTVPGTQYLNYGGNGLNANLSGIRINGSKDIILLVDGVRVTDFNGANNSGYMYSSLLNNMDNVERIEVLRGSAGALYGSGAKGGVINIITKSANRPFTGNVNARYGNNSGQKYTVSGGTKQNRFSSFTTISHRRRDTYTISDDKETERTVINPDGSITIDKSANSSTIRGYQIWDASQKFGYAFTDQFSAEIKGTYYRNKRDNATANAKTNDIFSNYSVNGKLKYLFNVNHRLDLSYIFDSYRKDIDYFVAGHTKKNYDNFVQTARLNYTGNFNDQHTFTAGLEANLEYLKHYMFKDSTNYNQQS